MKKICQYIISTFFIVVAFLPLPTLAGDSVIITLPDKRVAVISQGDLESESAGSYSVAVFKERALLNFVAGAVFPRDGSLFMDDGKARVEFANISAANTKDLILSMLTAGSGDYLQVDAIRIDSHSVKRLVSIQSDSKHDIVNQLRMAYKNCRSGHNKITTDVICGR